LVLNYVDFKNDIENGKTFSIYLFEGEDAFFRERGLSLVKKVMVSEPQLNFVSFEGDKLNEKEVVSSLTAYPFLSLKRVTVIREYYPKSNAIPKAIKDYLENPNEDSVLVIVNEKSCDSLKKFEAVCVVDCKKADAYKISQHVKAKCGLAGVAIDMETAKLIAEYCLCDMTRVDNETEKLIAYALQKKVITKQDVEGLVVQDTEYKIFTLTDFIAKKDFNNALKVIYEMLEKGETLQRLLISVYNYFKRLLHVAISDKTDAQLAEILSIKEFAVKKARTQAKGFKKKSLKNAVDMLADTDYLIKSGKVDAEDRIWHNLFSIITG
jgi:DNA polymerase-3 subunit delta